MCSEHSGKCKVKKKMSKKYKMHYLAMISNMEKNDQTKLRLI